MTKSRDLMEEDLPPDPEDVIKANLYLVLIIGSFIVLTFIAYLFNEGRHICVVPLLRKYRPKCKWVIMQDKLKAENEEKHSLELGLAQHAHLQFGMKKSSRAPSAANISVNIEYGI